MAYTNEQVNKARKAKSVEELLAMAKAENFPMTEEEAQRIYAELNKQGELSDDELDAVAGGGKNDPPEARFKKGDWISAKWLRGFYYYKVLDVTWDGTTYRYYCLQVWRDLQNGGTQTATYTTLYEKFIPEYGVTTFIDADRYADIT